MAERVIVRIIQTSVHRKHLELGQAQIASKVLAMIISIITLINIVIAMQYMSIYFLYSILLLTYE